MDQLDVYHLVVRYLLSHSVGYYNLPLYPETDNVSTLNFYEVHLCCLPVYLCAY
jgi:hypothetical protein